jgi:hypothetical protein
MGARCNVEDEKKSSAAAGNNYLPGRLVTAAALILVRCTAEKPPEVVRQSKPGLAPQKGQIMPKGLVART